MKPNLPPPPIIIRCTFDQSKTNGFPFLLEEARRGQFEEQRLTDGKRESVRYSTIFTLTPDLEWVKTVLAFAQALRFERRAQVTVNGLVVPPREVASILECYYHSLQCSDPRGHCWAPGIVHDAARTRAGQRAIDRTLAMAFTNLEVGEEERMEPEPPWFFPCRLASPSASRISRDHPASLLAQVEAVLAKADCTWCPQLRLTEWDARYGGHLQRTDEPQRP